MAEKNVNINRGWNTMSIIGFIFSFIFSPIGLIYSIFALRKINQTNQKGRGLAISGIVIGILFTLLLLFTVISSGDKDILTYFITLIIVSFIILLYQLIKKR